MSMSVMLPNRQHCSHWPIIAAIPQLASGHIAGGHDDHVTEQRRANYRMRVTVVTV